MVSKIRSPVRLYHAHRNSGRYNGTRVEQLKYFFEKETFGPDFYRRGTVADINIIAPTAAAVMSGNPVPYGANAPNGTYIIEEPPQRNFVSPLSLQVTVSKLHLSETHFSSLAMDTKP
jgi:hypothetical protein